MEVIQNVYIGSPAAVDAGYGLILNLSGVHYRAFPGQTVGTIDIDDKLVVSAEEAKRYLKIFIAGAEAIEAAKTESHRTKILVHCAAGINRSASVIAIWLVRNGYGYAEAMQVLTEANIRRGLPVLTNPSFREIIKRYAEFHGKCPHRYW